MSEAAAATLGGGEPPLNPWEALTAAAVGRTIEFWGFKLNHGRVWTLLYLRDEPMDASRIRQALGLSKGAVSMVTRELESWGVIHRVRPPGQGIWSFRAETQLRKMISRVIEQRESKIVGQAESQLAEAEQLARAADASARELEKLVRLAQLATAMRLALDSFLATSRLDLRALAELLAGEATRQVRRVRRLRPRRL